jgi:hypothetical protein
MSRPRRIGLLPNNPLPPEERERLWSAMLVAFPTVAAGNTNLAPEGVAHLVREQAEALIHEWKLTK